MADWSDLCLCPECGAANPSGAETCVKCGTDLVRAIADDERLRRERAGAHKAGRRPRGRDESKPADELTIADLRRHPVWQYDLAAEGGHDETWVKPVKRLPVSDL